ncbi:MAG TPA: HAD family phosphatase [Anaerolineales bacterium]|nr:HAD family phosphatase [Anaerolineales bacterium]
MTERPTRLQAVCWDMGGVLLRTFDWRKRRMWERRLHLPPGSLEREVFDGPASRLAMLGRATSADVWQEVARSHALSDDEARTLRADFFAGDRLDDELLAYIASLRPAIRTALISNAWPDVRLALGEAGTNAFFDEIVISAEVGAAKPDPSIYQIALDRLRLPAEAAAFVDDMPRNLEAARAIGMHVVLFNGTQRTIEAVMKALREEDHLGSV